MYAVIKEMQFPARRAAGAPNEQLHGSGEWTRLFLLEQQSTTSHMFLLMFITVRGGFFCRCPCVGFGLAAARVAEMSSRVATSGSAVGIGCGMAHFWELVCTHMHTPLFGACAYAGKWPEDMTASVDN